MEKVPGNGVDYGSDDGEKYRDPFPIIGCAPTECGMEVLTTDAKVAPTLEEWEAPMVDEVETPSELEGLPNIVKTMTRIADTVGVAPKERLVYLVLGGGVTPTIDGVIVPMVLGLRISAVKETMKAMVEEANPSMSSGGAASPNIGLYGSK